MSEWRRCTISYCSCPECGKQFPIPRKKNQSREKGHIKNIWCPFCKKVEAMKENKWEKLMEWLQK